MAEKNNTHKRNSNFKIILFITYRYLSYIYIYSYEKKRAWQTSALIVLTIYIRLGIETRDEGGGKRREGMSIKF
jgi:hypothetical protein